MAVNETPKSAIGEVLFGGMEAIYKEQLKNLRQDVTIDAEIKSIKNPDTGEYKVEYQGNLFSAFSQSLLTTYTIGERVYVLVPQGDYSGKKIILGRSSYQNTMSSKELSALQNYYIPQGPNWAEAYRSQKDGLQICACPRDNTGELVNPAHYGYYGFTREYPLPVAPIYAVGPMLSDAQLMEQDNQMIRWSEFYNYIKISANFRTDFVKTHLTGEYYLEVIFRQKNPHYQPEASLDDYDPRPYNLLTFKLGFDNFIGSPYGSVIDQPQSAYLKIPDGSSIIGIESIGLLQNGDFEFDAPITYDPVTFHPREDYSQRTLDRNNIFCSNIDIRFCEKVNLSEELYHPWIEAPKGNFVYAPTGDEIGCAAVELIAHLQFGDTDLCEQENCTVHWFRQKADATADIVDRSEKDKYGKTYYDYCGPGWYPIEKLKYNAITGNLDYVVDGNKLTIYKDAVPYKYNYMAVISILEEEELSTTAYDGSKIKSYKELNKVSVVQEVIRLDTKYDLSIEFMGRGDNGQQSLYRVVDHNDKSEIPWIWFGTWFAAGEDGSYNQISTPLWKGDKDLSLYLLNESATFYVMAYDPYIVSRNYDDPTATIHADEVGILKLEIGSTRVSNAYLTWEGQDTFFYDSNGGRSDNKEDKEYTLRPVVHFPDGVDAHYKLQIFAPGDVQLNSRDSQAKQAWANSQGYYSPEGYMLKDMYVENNVIHFHVASAFRLEHSRNNIFTVKMISINNQDQEFKKQVNFIKDGSQGNIGNEWHAQIRPCNFIAEDSVSLFTEQVPESEPSPLIVIPNGTKYIQDDKFRLILRPFVFRDNVPLENLDKQEGYFYRCFWDVRHPGNTQPEVKGSSFLRLHHVSRYDPTATAGVKPPAGAMFDNTTGGNAWETGPFGPKVGKNYEDIKVNDLETTPDGLTGYTVYPLSREFPGRSLDDETYGAVEVRFFDNMADGTGATLEQSQYRFIVKCQVDILRGQWSANKGDVGIDKRTEVVTEGQVSPVASIITYYPIDIFINDSGIKVDYNFGRNINTNWPKFVQYNAHGEVPEHEATDKLYFYYKNTDVNYPPVNRTVKTQSFEQKFHKDETGTVVDIDYWYRPNPQLNMAVGFHGALTTALGADFGESYFVRNQVMYLNLYGNVAVNGWDGVGIDTNEDEGTILGAMIGAGYKRPSTNTFTGVIMGRNSAYRRDQIEGYRAGVDKEQDDRMPYLTGLFGYQEGVESFGLLENGTAFFGRADGGGRIILDGSNGVIYGGANGTFKSPSIGDPMWNQMRLNLVDLTHIAENDDITQRGKKRDNLDNEFIEEVCYTSVNGVVTGFKGHYFGFNEDDDSQYSLPQWYADMWRNAYIKPDGARPYYLQKNADGKGYQEYTRWDPDTQSFPADPQMPPYSGEDPLSLTSKATNYRINYFDNNWITIKHYKRDGAGTITSTEEYDIIGTYTWDAIKADADLYKEYQYMVDDGIPYSLSSYGPQRASTTPAIEIGQHPHGLMPGIIPDEDYIEVMSTLSIPGDRNFMVTYDGTLWAMNAVVCGNIIGSNILGGKIMGARIVSGIPGEGQINDEQLMFIDPERYNCIWRELWPPQARLVSKEEIFPTGIEYGIQEDGSAKFNNCQIYGGSLDVGSFHIFGRGTADLIDAAAGETTVARNEQDFIGHLIQMGKSDFIGETHFYGDVMMGPNEHWRNETLDGLKKIQRGILAQTGSLTLLGILENENFLKGHQFCYDKILAEDWATTAADEAYYAGDQANFTQLIQDIGDDPKSYETASVFGILAYGDPEPDPTQIGYTTRGHFWPLHFKSIRTEYEDPDTHELIKGFQSYVTTMNQFKYKGVPVNDPPNSKDSTPRANTGTNYFRVSSWGTENIDTYIRSQFQDEQDNGEPKPDETSADAGTNRDINPTMHTYRGYIGLVRRAGHGDQSNVDRAAIGITSWNRNAVILHSDDTFATRTRFSSYILSGNRNKNFGGTADNTMAENWGDEDNYMGTMFHIAGSDLPTFNGERSALGDKINDTRCSIFSSGGRITLSVLSEEQRAAEIPDYGERTLSGRQWSSHSTKDQHINKSPASLVLQPYNDGEGDCQDISAKLWSWSGNSKLGGVHIYCQKAGIWQSNLFCHQAQQSELFIGDRKIGMMAQDRVVVGTFAKASIVGDGQAGANVHGVLENIHNGFGCGLICDRTTYNVPRSYLIGGEVHVIADIAGEHPGAVAELAFNSNGNAVMSARNIYLKPDHGNPHTPGGFGEPGVTVTGSKVGMWTSDNRGFIADGSHVGALTDVSNPLHSQGFVTDASGTRVQYNGSHYMSLGPDDATLRGYTPEHQFGFYARFA